jgi:DNA-binding NarL/FixJ family response regulator
MSDLTQVLVADDHELYRLGLVTVIHSMPEMECVGEVSNGEQAVQAAARLKPHVVIMDLEMPVLDGIKATRQIVERHPGTRVLVLSMHEDDERIITAFRAGAAGYLCKGGPAAETARALRTLMTGQVALDPVVATKLLQRVLGTQPLPLPELTDREREVLTLLIGGRTTDQVARALFLSPKTVRNHVSNIMQTLGVQSRDQAMRRGRAEGLGEDPVGPDC